ncbi:GntR family transcriptional regulator [Vineibacter terrae]|uniref:GntR family transcriptional regulator n=2 Tax=Vineibacter terrae TaxID=2586908 RepID=A0A5C8PRH4_9HYPH|nr:GntR family transcriptional regulator [Vineibacter terrae]
MDMMRRAVITGRYAPGQALREETLEAEYRVSRGPIREALRLLELRGLVTHAPRRGFRVRTYTVKDIEDLYRMRALLERHAVECLRDAALDALVERLEASNARMATQLNKGNIEGYLAENVTFHTLVIDASGNEPLKRTLNVLNEMAEPLRYALLSRNLKKGRSLADHRRITELLRSGRIDVAASTTEAHILDNLPALLALADKL